MMKGEISMRVHCIFMAFLLLTLLTFSACAEITIDLSKQQDGGNQIVLFKVSPGGTVTPEAAAAVQEQLDHCFEQSDALKRYARVLGRGGETVIFEQGMLYACDRFISMLLVRDGQQADGSNGSLPRSLCIHPETAQPIQLMDLFVSPDDARARLSEMIEQDIIPTLSDYLEFSDLLPVPENCFYLDADGLTIYYDDQHYRTLSGSCGAVSFAWYEIEDLIRPDGPAGGMIDAAPDAAALRADISEGFFGSQFPVHLGDRLGDVLNAYPELNDPDFTRDTKVYQFETAALRGFSVEIPKYAFTKDMDTPVSAIRSSRISFHGLKTGWSGKEEIVTLLGEPESQIVYDEQMAEDMMTVPGISLIYRIGKTILEVHLDEEQLLDALILRSELPE